MTKKEMFAEIRSKVADNAEMVAFLDHEIELLSKKRSSVNSKAKAESEARAIKVFNALAEMDNPVTVSELIKLTSDEEVAGFTNQRVSALLKKLVDCGKVNKIVDKKTSYFTVA